jgi:beta-hydroxylase
MLMRLFAPQFLVVWAFLGSALAVHFRGKVRLGFWRQVSDHSTHHGALQCADVPVLGRADAALDRASLPELAVLRDSWQ